MQRSESKELPSIVIGTRDRSVIIDGEMPAFIIGPCVIEDENFTWKIAKKLVELSDKLHFPLIFKASYDKANRTSIDSFRGPGAKDGCKILGQIGKELGVPVTTDVHTVEEIEIGIKNGVRKVNIDTYNRMAITGAIRKVLTEKKAEFDPRAYLKPAIVAMEEVCVDRFERFNCAGQASKIKVIPLADMARRYADGSLNPTVN